MDLKLPEDCALRFSPVRVIASGGFGCVLEARQHGLDRPVAIKLLLTGHLEEEQQRLRFEQEARIAAALSHPNIVAILDCGARTGIPWIAYELVPGRSLRQMVARGPLPVATAIDVTVQIARALEAAHAKGVVHRDLKPENILEAGPDWFKLADFGIAKWRANEAVRTETGVVLGTPAYLSPESIRGEPAAPAADLYSLGCLLFELVAGQPPFGEDNLTRVLEHHLRTIAPALSSLRPDVPASLDRLVGRLLEKDPADRPESAGALIAQLEQLEPERAGRTVAVSTPPDERPRSGRSGQTRKSAVPASAAPRTGGDTLRAAGPGVRNDRRPLAAVLLALCLAGSFVLFELGNSRAPGAVHTVSPEISPRPLAPSPIAPPSLDLEAHRRSTERLIVDVRHLSNAVNRAYGISILSIASPAPHTDGPSLLKGLRDRARHLVQLLASLDRAGVTGTPWFDLEEPAAALLDCAAGAAHEMEANDPFLADLVRMRAIVDRPGDDACRAALGLGLRPYVDPVKRGRLLMPSQRELGLAYAAAAARLDGQLASQGPAPPAGLLRALLRCLDVQVETTLRSPGSRGSLLLEPRQVVEEREARARRDALGPLRRSLVLAPLCEEIAGRPGDELMACRLLVQLASLLDRLASTTPLPDEATRARARAQSVRELLEKKRRRLPEESATANFPR